MNKRLLTAINVGAIIAVFLIVLRQPDGIFLVLVFVAFIVCALLAWWFIGRKIRS